MSYSRRRCFYLGTHLCAIWIHAAGYLHIQMMYFAAPWKSPAAEKISLLLANTHFISLPRALYLTAEFIHFLCSPPSALRPHPLRRGPKPKTPLRPSFGRRHSPLHAIIFAIRMSAFPSAGSTVYWRSWSETDTRTTSSRIKMRMFGGNSVLCR